MNSAGGTGSFAVKVKICVLCVHLVEVVGRLNQAPWLQTNLIRKIFLNTKDNRAQVNMEKKTIKTGLNSAARLDRQRITIFEDLCF